MIDGSYLEWRILHIGFVWRGRYFDVESKDGGLREDPPRTNGRHEMHNIRRYERQLSSSIRFGVSEHCDDDHLTRVATWDEILRLM